ncbi:MAG: PorV/PorQ family protein [Flavobacteriales bacterium]|nr:PorV/PorQ family protein [Flavobacteriales bacterium]
MKKITLTIAFALALVSFDSIAGNEDRAGEAGASELLINPWARSSGWGGANTASIRGLEAMNLNVAGLSFVKNVELVAANTRWLSGTDINIFSIGFAKKMGESGALGISITSMSFGEIDVTTVALPDGGVGTYEPNYLNIGVAYSKKFSNSISGGLVVRMISEATADVKAGGLSIDVGVNYVTAENDAFKFGITLRNVGPTTKYQGNGLSIQSDVQNTDRTLTFQRRSNEFELPSLVNIGASYDFFLTEAKETEDGAFIAEHRITTSGTFTSNAFTRDQIRIGAEYAFQNRFMVRGGYVYETDTNDETITRTTSVGPTVGATIEVPTNESGSTIGIDYSYRVTRTFDGTHAIGLRLAF